MNDTITADDGLRQAPPLPVPFEEGKWGAVIYWYMPLPGIFVLGTTREEDVFVVEPAKCAGVLPEGVFQYGAPYDHGIYIYFGHDTGRDIVKYELLLCQAQRCPPEDRQAFLDAALMAALYGAEACPDYFGAWMPQHTTPWGRMTRYRKVDNGVWLVQAGGEWALSVCSVKYGEIGLVGLTRKYAKGDPEQGEDMYWAWKTAPRPSTNCWRQRRVSSNLLPPWTTWSAACVSATRSMSGHITKRSIRPWGSRKRTVLPSPS